LALDSERRREIRDVWILILAALILRAAWALWSHKFWGYREDWAYDDGAFLGMAQAFLGHGTISATHPPGYSLFLAPFLALGGDLGVSAARWVQMLLSSATAALAYRLALSLKLERRAALAAGVLVVVHPMLVFFSVRMMSESFFLALVLGFLLLWLEAWKSGDAKFAAWAGILGGAATLTRGVILPFAAVLAAVALWRRREQARWLELTLICGLVWAAVLLPWTARNWGVYRRFVPISVQGGWNFYEGLTVDPDEIRFKRATAMGEESRSRGLSDVFEVDAYFGAKARSWVRENPREFLRLVAIKAVRFWRPAPERPHALWVRLGAGTFTVGLFLLACFGAWALRFTTGFWFLAAWAAHLNVLHAVFASNLRYRLPLEPVLAVLAGAGLAALLRRRS